MTTREINRRAQEKGTNRAYQIGLLRFLLIKPFRVRPQDIAFF